MKSFLCLILLSGLSISISAYPDWLSTEPEKIVSITQLLYEKDYYETQVLLWEEKLSEDKSDADAWMHYYLASRIVNLLTKDHSPHNLDEIYQDIAINVNDSYEYHYLTYLNGQGKVDLFPHLEKAFALNPSRTEVLSHMVN